MSGTGERLQRIAAGPGRDELIPLLLLADDSEAQVRSYYQQGELFAVRGDDGIVIGITLAIPTAGGGVEVKAVAVAPALHGRGVGQRMMKMVLTELRAAGVRQVTVGTSSSGIGQLAFYQKVGFRLWKIERDFFSPDVATRKARQRTGFSCATWSGWIRRCSVARHPGRPT